MYSKVVLYIYVVILNLFFFLSEKKYILIIVKFKKRMRGERSFLQNTKPDQSKTTLLHYTMIIIDEDMCKISQETKIKLSQMLSTPFELQTDIQLS